MPDFYYTFIPTLLDGVIATDIRTPTQTNTEALQARGVRVLTDDEVIDKGKYVIWKDFDPSWCTVLLDPARLISILSDMREYSQERKDSMLANRYVCHATKPLRIESATLEVNGAIKRYYVARDISQKVVEFRDGYYDVNSTRDTVGPFTGTPVQIHKQPREVRQNYMQWLLHRMGDIYSRPSNFDHHATFVNQLFATPRRNPLVSLRGVWVSAITFAHSRKALRQLGVMIARSDDYDAEDVISHLDRLDSSIHDRIKHSVVDAWNERSSSYTELTVAACGHVCEDDATHDTYSGDVCNSCFEDEYVWVENTEDYRHRDNVYCHDDDCYYTYEQEDPDDDDDDDDDDESAGGLIRNYSTNVLNYHGADHTIRVSPFGEFLMGVELEVMPKDGYRSEAASDTFGALCQGYAILKNDGSLGGRGGYADGFEIVTAPRGLAEHVRRFKEWEPHAKLRAWDPGKCGMHVHISSAAFSSATLGKYIEFINAKGNTKLIASIAGRTPETDANANDYCQREGRVYTGNPKKTIEGKNLSRYYMINTTNLDYDETVRLGLHPDHAQKGINTIELRIFRATLSKPRLLAQLEFAHAALMFCRWSSMRELDHEHFVIWLRDTAGTYPHLAKWLGVKANKKEVDPAPAVRETADV